MAVLLRCLGRVTRGHIIQFARGLGLIAVELAKFAGKLLRRDRRIQRHSALGCVVAGQHRHVRQPAGLSHSNRRRIQDVTIHGRAKLDRRIPALDELIRR